MGGIQGVTGALGIEVGRNESDNLLGESIDRSNARFLQSVDSRKGELKLPLEGDELWDIQGQVLRSARL